MEGSSIVTRADMQKQRCWPLPSLSAEELHSTLYSIVATSDKRGQIDNAGEAIHERKIDNTLVVQESARASN